MRDAEEIRNKFNDIRGYLKAYRLHSLNVSDVDRLMDEFETWMFKEDKSNAETRTNE